MHRRGLACSGLLAVILGMAQPGQAQDGGGLVISALPSATVIGASDSPAISVSARPGPIVAMPGGNDGSAPDLPRAAGLPKPSIIVGDLAILAAIGPRGPLGLPFPAREAIRQRDSALFERLLGRGVFDPEPARMAEALQTELLRMACYSGRIDGDWGRGSQSAAERWQKAANAQTGTEADLQLFRAIARSGDMTCPAIAPPAPAVVAAKPKPSVSKPKPARGGGSGGNPVRRQPPQVAQPKPPVAAKPSGPTINPVVTGAGIFR